MNKVKGYRTMLGLTQEEMAEKLGVSINTYAGYETNPEKMSITVAKKFLEVVNEVDNTITLNEIFLK